MLTIRPDDLTGSAVRALVAEHLAQMHATSPAESVHALAADALVGPGMRFFTAWDGAELLGMAALKELDPERAEIKSMRTSAAGRGRGTGRALLRHLVAEAAASGHRSLWLETGVEDLFLPARTLYGSEGFRPCPPFGDYVLDPHSVFMTRAL
ncbi:GNAT family N-acetyltransferase [Serinibacter arcticus]|uniref:GNAT family N-acetyltransferase n=1 Tax=Serinibacter arcticus TaxID=1655435 RepID=A0A2U1ZWI0_9MICO|nr:GNAT family N-acetyltransferase [Serinibacter arcticus]PWD51324.1 GNAT family N-acetyltransferase [Serinibacter arcticus]